MNDYIYYFLHKDKEGNLVPCYGISEANLLIGEDCTVAINEKYYGKLMRKSINLPDADVEQRWQDTIAGYSQTVSDLETKIKEKQKIKVILDVNNNNPEQYTFVSEEYPSIKFVYPKQDPRLIFRMDKEIDVIVKEYSDDTGIATVESLSYAPDAIVKIGDCEECIATRMYKGTYLFVQIQGVKASAAIKIDDIYCMPEGLSSETKLEDGIKLKLYVTRIKDDGKIDLSQCHAEIKITGVKNNGELQLEKGHEYEVLPILYINSGKMIQAMYQSGGKNYLGGIKIQYFKDQRDALERVTLGQPLTCIYEGETNGLLDWKPINAIERTYTKPQFEEGQCAIVTIIEVQEKQLKVKLNGNTVLVGHYGLKRPINEYKAGQEIKIYAFRHEKHGHICWSETKSSTKELKRADADLSIKKGEVYEVIPYFIHRNDPKHIAVEYNGYKGIIAPKIFLNGWGEFLNRIELTQPLKAVCKGITKDGVIIFEEKEYAENQDIQYLLSLKKEDEIEVKIIKIHNTQKIIDIEIPGAPNYKANLLESDLISRDINRYKPDSKIKVKVTNINPMEFTEIASQYSEQEDQDDTIDEAIEYSTIVNDKEVVLDRNGEEIQIGRIRYVKFYEYKTEVELSYRNYTTHGRILSEDLANGVNKMFKNMEKGEYFTCIFIESAKREDSNKKFRCKPYLPPTEAGAEVMFLSTYFDGIKLTGRVGSIKAECAVEDIDLKYSKVESDDYDLLRRRLLVKAYVKSYDEATQTMQVSMVNRSAEIPREGQIQVYPIIKLNKGVLLQLPTGALGFVYAHQIATSIQEYNNYNLAQLRELTRVDFNGGHNVNWQDHVEPFRLPEGVDRLDTNATIIFQRKLKTILQLETGEFVKINTTDLGGKYFYEGYKMDRGDMLPLDTNASYHVTLTKGSEGVVKVKVHRKDIPDFSEPLFKANLQGVIIKNIKERNHAIVDLGERLGIVMHTSMSYRWDIDFDKLEADRTPLMYSINGFFTNDKFNIGPGKERDGYLRLSHLYHENIEMTKDDVVTGTLYSSETVNVDGKPRDVVVIHLDNGFRGMVDYNEVLNHTALTTAFGDGKIKLKKGVEVKYTGIKDMRNQALWVEIVRAL